MLQISVWEQELASLLDAALREAGKARLELLGHPAVVLQWQLCDALCPAQLLEGPPPASVRVRFESPTFFGFGRYENGTSRSHVTPDPGLVVASWLRAWKLTGDRSLDWLPTSPEDLGMRIALREMREVRTVIVKERTVSLTGFLGECVYRWEGNEPAGVSALSALTRFAEACGTGAKTGRGFGQTALTRSSIQLQPTGVTG